MYHSDLDEVGEPFSPPHASPKIKLASAQLMWNGHLYTVGSYWRSRESVDPRGNDYCFRSPLRSRHELR